MTEETNTLLHAASGAQPQSADDTQTPAPTDPYAAVVLPENSYLQPGDLAAFKQAAGEVKLPAEALQKWLALEETRLQNQNQQAAEAQRQKEAAWVRQTQEELGPQWQEEVSKAVRAADVFGGPELRQLLEETGLGNHPVIVRTFAGIGTRISEDSTPGGVTPGTQTDKTFTQALYGKN